MFNIYVSFDLTITTIDQFEKSGVLCTNLPCKVLFQYNFIILRKAEDLKSYDLNEVTQILR